MGSAPRDVLFLGGGGTTTLTPGTTVISGGTDTRVLFNDGGTVGEDAGLTFNKTTDALTLGGRLILPATGVVGTEALPEIIFGADTDTGIYQNAANQIGFVTGGVANFRIAGNALIFGSGVAVQWRDAASAIDGSTDLLILRDAANTLAQRNGTAAQEFRLYNTWTDASNYERAVFQWSSNEFYFATAKAGSGSARNFHVWSEVGAQISLGSGADHWRIISTGHLVTPTDNTYDIGASGATRPRNIYLAQDLVLPSGTGNFIRWSTDGSRISNASNGVIRLTDSSEAAFGSLLFGGSGTTYNRLKHDAAGVLAVKLANDSAYSTLLAMKLQSGAANGQSAGVEILTELTTIAAAATTDTAIQIPANAIVFGVSVRVTTVIPTAATFTVIGTTSSTAFQTGANVSTVATTTDAGTKSCPYLNTTAQTIRITPDLTPGDNSGRVRVSIHFVRVTPPTS